MAFGSDVLVRIRTVLDTAGLGGLPSLIATAFAVDKIRDFTNAVIDAQIQFDKTKNTLEFVSGSAQKAAESYAFIRSEADRLGLAVGPLAEQFSKFQAAAKGSVVTADDVITVFQGITNASVALGIASTDTERTIRAFTQIIAKGKVTAEEFRGQIGDALPVATTVAAKALGVTTSEFSRMLDAGELTLEFIPKLGQALKDEFAEPAEKASGKLRAELGRLESKWTDLKLQFADRGGTDIAISGLSLLQSILGGLSGAIDAVGGRWQELQKLFSTGNLGADVGLAKLGSDFDKLVTDLGGKTRKELANAIPGQSLVQKELPRSPIFFPVKRNFEEEAKLQDKATKASERFSDALENEKKASDIAREALRLGGDEGKRFAIVEAEKAKAIASGIPLTEQQLQGIQDLANSKIALDAAQKAETASVQVGKRSISESVVQTNKAASAARGFAEGLRQQAAQVKLESEALAIGGAEGERFSVIQGEINKALESGVAITPELITQITAYAESLGKISAAEFSQSLTEQTAEIEAQSTAFQIGSETSAQYAALQDQIVEQLEQGIPVTEAQRQALISLGQEEERYTIIQSKIQEAIANRIELTADLIQQIRDQADAQVNLNAEREVNELSTRAAENLTKEFDRQADAITQTLTDAIFRGFENGKGFAENFKDTVVNLFKTLILRPVIEAVVKPVAQIAQNVIGSLVQGVLGTDVLGGLFQQGASALFSSVAGSGMFSNVVSGGSSTASSGGMGILTNAVQSGLGSVVTGLDTVTAAINQLGAQAGLTGGASGQAGLFGTASASSLLSTIGGAAGIATLGYSLGGLVGAQTGSAIQGAAAGTATGAAAGAAIGSVVPVIGTAIGAIIGALFGGVGGGMGYQTPPRGFATFSAKGVPALGGKKGFDPGTSLVPLGKEIQDSIAAIDKDLGLKLIQNRIKFWIGFKQGKGYRTTVAGKGDTDFEDPGRLQAEILRQEIKDADSGLKKTEFQKRVLERGLAKETLEEQLKQIDKDLQVRQKLRAFVKQVEFDPRTEKIKELRTTLAELTTTFSKLKSEAQELGLNTKKAEEAFKKTRRRTLDEILGVKLDRASERIGIQQQAFQLAGQNIPQELQAEGVEIQFKALRIQFRELGLDTKVLNRLLGEALKNLQENIVLARDQAKATAFQLAGRTPPPELQRQSIISQFEQISQEISNANSRAIQEAEARAAQTEVAARRARVQEIRARVPREGHTVETIQAAIDARIAAEAAYVTALTEADRARITAAEDAALLAELLKEALQNAQDSIVQAEIARRQAQVDVVSRAYQLAGREVPIFEQSEAIRAAFRDLGLQFQELGLDATILTQLLAESLQNLTETAASARRQTQVDVFSSAFQAAGREVPLYVKQIGLQLQFAELGKRFRELGLDAGILAMLFADASADLVTAQEQARQSAIERAYQLAGEEVPKAIQIAGITAEFALLKDLFEELGLDSGILGSLLQKAVDKINKAGEDLKDGGFIGFLDEFGRITELDPRKFDIDRSANDNQFGGDIQFGGAKGTPGLIDGRITQDISKFATGTQNRIVTRPELFLAGEAGPETVSVRPLSGPTAGNSQGDININLNGPAIFDDISVRKFTREVDRQLQSRRLRFG